MRSLKTLGTEAIWGAFKSSIKEFCFSCIDQSPVFRYQSAASKGSQPDQESRVLGSTGPTNDSDTDTALTLLEYFLSAGHCATGLNICGLIRYSTILRVFLLYPFTKAKTEAQIG